MPRKNLLSLHEALVVALINQPTRTASFDEIARFIEERNLCPERKGKIPLSKQVMLRATKSKGAYHHLFEELGAGFIRLKNTIDPLATYNSLETLLQYDRRFYEPVVKELNVVDKNFERKRNRRIKISPADVICICSTSKGREKCIYTAQNDTKGDISVVRYHFNNSSYKFEKLCEYLDPASGYLVMVSRSAIVNVAYYELSGKSSLKPASSFIGLDIPAPVSLGAKANPAKFQLVRKAYIRRVLLQKTAIGYKMDMNL